MLEYAAVPDVHHACAEWEAAMIEGIARHFPALAPAIRGVAQHLEDTDVGIPLKCCGLVAGPDDPPPAA